MLLAAAGVAGAGAGNLTSNIVCQIAREQFKRACRPTEQATIECLDHAIELAEQNLANVRARERQHYIEMGLPAEDGPATRAHAAVVTSLKRQRSGVVGVGSGYGGWQANYVATLGQLAS